MSVTVASWLSLQVPSNAFQVSALSFDVQSREDILARPLAMVMCPLVQAHQVGGRVGRRGAEGVRGGEGMRGGGHEVR